MWPFRSLLFVPSHKPDWVRKVPRTQPDAVILDLEDAVPADLKRQAGELVPESAAFLMEAGIGAFVRINAIDIGGIEDVGRIVSRGLTGIVLPKADSPQQIRELDRLLSFHEGCVGLPHGEIAIVPLPETANGLYSGKELAAASPRVKGLFGAMLGSGIGGDTAWAAGFKPTEEGFEQLYLGSKLALESRAGGAPYPISVVNGMKVDDLATVRILTKRVRALGYTGVAIIHPSHVAIVHEVYTPSEEEVKYCQALIATLENAEASGDGAVRYQGQMIDHAMVVHAQEVLHEARRRTKSAPAHA